MKIGKFLLQEKSLKTMGSRDKLRIESYVDSYYSSILNGNVRGRNASKTNIDDAIDQYGFEADEVYFHFGSNKGNKVSSLPGATKANLLKQLEIIKDNSTRTKLAKEAKARVEAFIKAAGMDANDVYNQ